MKYTALLVEGDLDETVGRRIVETAGGKVTDVYGKRGSGYIEKKLQGFNQAAKGTPILALLDLMDTEFDCPIEIIKEWLPQRSKNMLFRLVVWEIESWLLADRTNLARFLGVPKNKVPRSPEEEIDPKRKIVNLARQSRYRRVRDLLVPEKGISASQGRGYTSEMQRFVRDDWSLDEASKKSESLNRCLAAATAFFDE